MTQPVHDAGDPEDYAGEPVDDAFTPRILVAALDHPEVDDWVRHQAAAEAARASLVLGEYRGREDVLGELRPPGMCCHVFAAEYPPGASDGS